MRIQGNTTITRVFTAAAAALALATTPAQAVLIGFEAENGNSASTTVTATLGADFIPAVSDPNAYGGSYITSATDFILPATSPGDAARVVSYDVNFAEAGDYDLYGRLLVEVDGGDDSLYLPTGFGAKSPTTAGDWIVTNRIFDNAAEGIGAGVYAWVNLSQWPDFGGGAQFTVPSAGVQTLQIGARENGIWFDAFAFGSTGETFSGVDFEVAVTGALSSQWGVDSGGSFGQQGAASANWTDGNVPASDAVFGGFLAAANAPAVVTLDSPVSLDSITFNNANDYILTGPETLTLTGVAKVDTQLGRHWLMAGVAGSGGLNASGGGELVLTADNSFSGGLTVNNTNVAVTNAAAVPAGNDIALTDSAQLRFWGSDNGFFGDGVANGTGAATGLDPNTNLNVAGSISVDATSTVDVNSGADVTLSGVVSGAGSVAVNSGAKLALTNAANSYFGVTSVNGGSLTLGAATALGDADGSPGTQTFVAGGASDGVLVLNGNLTVSNELLELSAREGAGVDNVHVTSSGNNTWAGNIKGSTGGTNYNLESTSGTLTLAGTISAPDNNPRNFVFSGAGDVNITGKLVDAIVTTNGDFDLSSEAANVTVTKRGAGVLTINTKTDNNDDYWYGSTTVEEGTLEVLSQPGANGPDGELRSTVAVRQGATLDVDHFSVYNLIPLAPYEVGIGGGGTVLAQTLGAFESSTITPGDGVGTLKVQGNVRLTYFDSDETVVPNTGSLDFELGDDATIDSVDNAENDLVSVSGSVEVNMNSGASGNAFVVNVTPTDGGFDTVNNYTLMRGSSRIGNATTSNFTVNIVDSTGAPIVSRYNAAVALTGTSVELNVGGGAADRTWSGAVSSSWDIAITNNWQEGDQQYQDLDHVTFDDSASGAGEVVVTLDSARSPASVTFANASRSYTLGGAGGIIGTASVDVSGGGGVTLANSGNSYTGATTVAAGATLRYAADATTGDISSAGALSIGNSTATSTPVAIVNGDFEADADDTSPPTGWTDLSATPSFWVSEMGDNNSPGPADLMAAGFENNFLNTARLSAGAGSQPVDGTLVQTVDLSAFAADIDNGDRQFFVEFDWGSGDSNDTANFSLAFFGSTDGSGAALGPVFTEALDDANGFNFVSAHEAVGGAIPVGARSVTLQIDSTRASGSQTDMVFDNFLGSLGDGVNSSASLNVQGDFTLEDGSSLELVLESATSYSQVIVDGLFTADGELILTELAGATFSEGDTFDLFAFGSAAGAFDSLDLPSLDSGLAWDSTNLLLTGQLAIVSAGLPGDFNGDLVVDAADYTVWRANFGLAEDDLLSGNGDGGTIDQSDYDLWAANYGRTSVLEGAANSEVPEPAALALLGGILCCAGLARRRVGAAGN